MEPFLALITPIGTTPPPQPPLGIWGPTDPRPTLPIAGWNPGTGNFPPWSPPPVQPPLGIWGPGDPRPTLPIAGWNPGTGNFPPWVPPSPPLGIWGGSNQPFPTNPIAGFDPIHGTFPKPPGGGTEEPKFEWKTAWSPQTGWIVVAIPLFPVPTPSADKAEDKPE
jgi:hypothetical protein